ncbi:MAG: DUF4386 domain-containing protein [Chitinophagaceae bacterium]|nr:DUF4386 domain-containing protein [Chitinophagaceae bacterium]
MRNEKRTGWLLLTGGMAVLVPYTLLVVQFDYPDVLRKEPGDVLRAFHQGGIKLIFIWLAFALSGLPLLIAYKMIGRQLDAWFANMKWVTTIGTASLVFQIVGLLRWVFVVPMLANDYVSAAEPSEQFVLETVFRTVHQFGGVLLGEHLGQLFTVIWTVAISWCYQQLAATPKWISWLGYLSSIIYFMGQAELLATVIPSFPNWSAASFIGSTLWLIWLIAMGIIMLQRKE